MIRWVRLRPALPEASAVRTRHHGGHSGHGRCRRCQPRPLRGARVPAPGAPRRCPSRGRPAGHVAELPGRVPRPPGRVPRPPPALDAAHVGRIFPRAAMRGAPARAYNRAPCPCRLPHRRSRALHATVPQRPGPARSRRQPCHRPDPTGCLSRPRLGGAARKPCRRRARPVEPSYRSASQHRGHDATSSSQSAALDEREPAAMPTAPGVTCARPIRQVADPATRS